MIRNNSRPQAPQKSIWKSGHELTMSQALSMHFVPWDATVVVQGKVIIFRCDKLK